MCIKSPTSLFFPLVSDFFHSIIPFFHKVALLSAEPLPHKFPAGLFCRSPLRKLSCRVTWSFWGTIADFPLTCKNIKPFKSECMSPKASYSVLSVSARVTRAITYYCWLWDQINPSEIVLIILGMMNLSGTIWSETKPQKWMTKQ